jgi:isoleucyl-tRNA synthetase
MTNYLDDTRLSKEILSRNVEAYRKIRNTCRFLLGNLHDFDPGRDGVEPDEMEEIDRWILFQLREVGLRVRKGYENYEFHTVYHTLHHFCTVTLSSIYLDILKDRLYTASRHGAARRSAQSALFRTADSLCRLMAPILCFTAEEIWKELAGLRPAPESVHLAEFPDHDDLPDDAEMAERWTRLLAVREEVQKFLETAREEKRIGNSLEAKVRLAADSPIADLLVHYRDSLPTLFIVSQVEIGAVGDTAATAEKFPSLRIEIEPADGKKCERCWNYATDVGADEDFPTVCGRCVGPVREYLDESK